MIESFKLPNITPETLTDSIVTFNSQYAGLPLKSHTVNLVAKQAAGTPSPSNPKAITGFSVINISHSGKNLLESTMNVSCALITDGIRIISGGTSLICHLKKGMTYTISGLTINRGVVGFFDYVPSVNDETDRTQNIPNTGVSTFTSNYDGLAVIYINNGNVDVSTAIIELGNQDTPYEPYNGTYTTIQIGSTVYGGEYDARTGVLTVTHGFIASYNGETINEPWISSMDKYVEGTTPTNGAQVVYPLSTPQTIQLPPCPIDTLQGVNNIWADTGDTTLQYIKIQP